MSFDWLTQLSTWIQSVAWKPQVNVRCLPERMEGSTNRARNIYAEIISQAIAVGGLLLGLRMVAKYMDPYREQRKQAAKRAAFLRQHLGKTVQLNEYEQLLAPNVMNPNKIDVSLEDISGLEDIVAEMELKVLYPMLQPEVYCTTLWRRTKGVLLYGPPGTGKTMLAKALARESGCFFLNLTASAVMSKWLGDANRLIRAVFTLAEKLQPCIIFIDEVDAILGKRGSNHEHEATLQVKTEFMQLWDGMESAKDVRVLVMGATNRPWVVDEAVLRRFSLQYEIGLPGVLQRAAIIRGYLRKHHQELGEGTLGGVHPDLLHNHPVEKMEGSGRGPSAPGVSVGAIDWIASQTEGFSGSDLMELCMQAAQRVLAEFWQMRRGNTLRHGEMDLPRSTRPVAVEDFRAVLKDMRPSTSKATEYQEGTLMSSMMEGDSIALLRSLMALSRATGASRGNMAPGPSRGGLSEDPGVLGDQSNSPSMGEGIVHNRDQGEVQEEVNGGLTTGEKPQAGNTTVSENGLASPPLQVHENGSHD